MSEIKAFAEQLKKKFEDAEVVGIISHKSPDGDNLGSLEAMWGCLKGMGKKVILHLK